MSAELKSTNTPPMGEFKVSNSLLGNRAALDEAWERDGYWFFRDVLDRDAVARVTAIYLDVMKSLDMIDANAKEAIHNGTSLENFPLTNHNNLERDPLFLLNPMKAFVAEPAIHAFFKRLIGDEPAWLPVTEYHVTPPRQDRNRSRFNFIHRDSTTNPCIPFCVCWIPLSVIDDENGGLALTEGLHRPRPSDNPPSPIPHSMPIPESLIPKAAWRRATYRPGDVLMFDKDSPHSGLANYSSRSFRLSMDIRLMRASDRLPMIGTVTAVDDKAITVTDTHGNSERFVFDAQTYCRDFTNVEAASHRDIARLAGVGAQVIVSSQSGMARLIRPQR